MSADIKVLEGGSAGNILVGSAISVDDIHCTDTSNMESRVIDENERLIAEESKVHDQATVDTTLEKEDECTNHHESRNDPVAITDISYVNLQWGNDIFGTRLQFNAENESSAVTVHDNGPIPKRYDPSIDQRLPRSVTILNTLNGGKLYLVGTAHYSVESQNEVGMIIEAVQPHVVAIELCKSRMGGLLFDETTLYDYAKNLTCSGMVATIKEKGVYNGLLFLLISRMTASVTSQLGMAPGGEFRRAFKEAKKVPNCIVHLADRPINITLQRAMRWLTWWQTMKIMWQLMFCDEHISKEEVEQYKERSVIDQMISGLKEEYPAIEEAFIKERDLYLSFSLRLATLYRSMENGDEPARVVGVVGMGHVQGIVNNWCKVDADDISTLLSIPPRSLSSKIITFTIKASLLSAVVYIGYKIIPLPSGVSLHSVKSMVQGLFKIVVSMEATACADEYEHTVPDVMYIVNNIPGPGVDLEYFESEYSSGCSCTTECSDCSCTRGSPNYSNARILEEKLVGPILECNSHCTCGENCGNRLVQRGPLDSLLVSEISGKGLGLFTSKQIRKGQFICEYAGEVIGIEVAQNRVEENKRNNSMNYVLVVHEHMGDRAIVTCIDPKYFGNIGRYSNHSCRPSATLVPIRVEGAVPRLCLFASRDVGIDEEITFDYAGGISNSGHELSDTPCFCGSSNCSGYLPHTPI